MIKNIAKLSIRVALVAAVAFPLLIAMSARAQAPAPANPPPTGTTGSNIAPTGGAAPAAAEATAERVVVTGSNIPTAEEVGPNPVDTYRRDDITRLGVRTPTDLVLRIPASTGSNTTENNNNGGDGTNLRNITNNPAFDGWPSWSPDGKWIAFASNRESAYQIYIMDPDGGNVRLVANTEGRATAPRWSSDSKTIYFTNCRHSDYGYDCEVFVAKLSEVDH